MKFIISLRSCSMLSLQPGKSNLSTLIAAICLIAVTCLTTSICSAARIRQPAGLNPGAQYRLVFTTGGLIEPRSSNIQVYNSFVAAEAALPNSIVRGLNTGWSAIASTEFTSARINTNTVPTPAGLTGVPLYLVDGVTRIADNYDDLWDGTIDAPIELTQFGTAPIGGAIHPSVVWTGTRTDGTSYLAYEPFTMGTGSVVVGFSSSASDYWIDASLIGVGGSDRRGHLYAISGVLTAVPEPTSGAFLAALFLFAGAHRQRFRVVAGWI